jgi:hypothetical protein
MSVVQNEPCPCGSGKKHKDCCDGISKTHAEIFDEIKQIMAMNANLTISELNAVVQHKFEQQNSRPNADFCGLSSAQIANWLYAPLNELEHVNINTPNDVSRSPVMRYLALILDEAMQNDGSFKATPKGNLPTNIVKQATALLPEFAVSKYPVNISISEYAGNNEDKFNALHYTRVLAEIAGIVYRRSGRYHVKKMAQKQYQKQGVQAFFKPMLEAAIYQYNWEYLDGWEYDIDLRRIWLFMVWRVQHHASFKELIDEVETAFPVLLQSVSNQHPTPKELLSIMIEIRFINRFLQYWGFVVLESRYDHIQQSNVYTIEVQPLLTQTFDFLV